MAVSRTIAVLVGNPALSSILTMTLAASPALKVRPFESTLALSVYLRIAPIDLLVLDLDSRNLPAAQVMRELHFDLGLDRPEFEVIALTSRVTPALREAGHSAGIDEIVVKPMSPRYLLERVEARIAAARKPDLPPAPRPSPPLAPPPDLSNVIPLWTRNRPLPTH
jgi:DNA-binding response OmpR family regulator